MASGSLAWPCCSKKLRVQENVCNEAAGFVAQLARSTPHCCNVQCGRPAPARLAWLRSEQEDCGTACQCDNHSVGLHRHNDTAAAPAGSGSCNVHSVGGTWAAAASASKETRGCIAHSEMAEGQSAKAQVPTSACSCHCVAEGIAGSSRTRCIPEIPQGSQTAHSAHQVVASASQGSQKVWRCSCDSGGMEREVGSPASTSPRICCTLHPNCCAKAPDC
mmetsp:Transcript_28745/g.66750  ORF Transcript_28745/g.66750 Transcript_28745/m.66750 type:complete len:219 (-) Transcript_28745:3198-3854(-)